MDPIQTTTTSNMPLMSPLQEYMRSPVVSPGGGQMKKTTTDQLILRQHLRSTLDKLSADLVELINNEYLHFINLSLELEPVPNILTSLKSGIGKQKDYCTSMHSQCHLTMVEYLRLLDKRRSLIEKKRFCLDLLSISNNLEILSSSVPSLDDINNGSNNLNRIQSNVDLIVDTRFLIGKQKTSSPLVLQFSRKFQDEILIEWERLMEKLLLDNISNDDRLRDSLQMANSLNPAIISNVFKQLYLKPLDFASLDVRELLEKIKNTIQMHLLPIISHLSHSQSIVYRNIISFIVSDSDGLLSAKSFSVSSKQFHDDYLAFDSLFKFLGESPHATLEISQLLSDYLSSKFNINLFFSIQFKQIITNITSSSSSSTITRQSSSPSNPISRNTTHSFSSTASSGVEMNPDTSTNSISHVALLNRFHSAINHIQSSFIDSIAYKYLKVFFQCCIFVDSQISGNLSIFTAENQNIKTLIVDLVNEMSYCRQVLHTLTLQNNNNNDASTVQNMLDYGFAEAFKSIPNVFDQLQRSYTGHYGKQCIEQAKLIKNVPILYRRKADTMVMNGIYDNIPMFPSETIEQCEKLLSLDLKSWNMEIIRQTLMEFVKFVQDLIVQMDSLKRLKRNTDDDQDKEIMSIVGDNVNICMEKLKQIGFQDEKLLQELQNLQFSLKPSE